MAGTQPEQEFEELAGLAAAICGTPMGLVTLLGAEWQHHKGAVGMDLLRLPRDQSFCDHAVRQNGVLIVRDATKDSRFSANPLVKAAPYIRFYAGVPIHMTSGEKVGAVCVFDTIQRDLKAYQVSALLALARQVNAQLELRVLRREIELAGKTAAAFEELLSTLNGNPSCLCNQEDRSGRLRLYNQRFPEYFAAGRQIGAAGIATSCPPSLPAS